MNLYFGRVRTINVTKNLIFIGIMQPYQLGYKQIMVRKDNELMSSINDIHVNDIIYFTANTILNNRGLELFNLKTIEKIIPCLLDNNQKKFANMSMDKRHLINTLNGKEEIKVWNIKNEIFSFLRDYFTRLQYKEVVGDLLEEVRTSSSISPFSVLSKCRDQNYYLRITLENYLKQTTALTLESTFALQSVFYDKVGKKQESPQTQTLEFVSLNFDDDKMINFLTDYFEQILLLAKTFGLEIPVCEKLTVLQYSEALKYIPDFGKHHLKPTKLNSNLIVLNVPVNSPYILEKDGKKVELQWYIRGHYVAHSYFDEVDYQKVINSIRNQAIYLGLTEYNQMTYFNLGLPLTYSGGLGIEKSLMFLLGLHHMKSIQNPIGVNSLEKEYVKKLRRERK